MIKIPLNDIIAKIKEKANVSEEEINTRINNKLKQLSGLISKEGAAHIVANELGIRLIPSTSGKLQIKNILTGMRDVETVGKVLDVYELKEFNLKERIGRVGSFVIGDETGVIRVVLWNEQANNIKQLKKDMIVRIKGAYVKENNNRQEVHLGDRGSLVINPEGETIGEVKQLKPSKKTINSLEENDNNVEVLGTIVQVNDPRFYEVCSICGKRIRLREDIFVCDQHGKTKPDYACVITLFLDDGSGNIRAVFFRNQAEKLLTKSPEQILEFKESPEKFEQIKNDLLGNIIKVSGRVNKNTLFDRLELIAKDVFLNVNPEEEMKQLETNQEAI